MYIAKSRLHHLGHTRSGDTEGLENQNDYARQLLSVSFTEAAISYEANRRLQSEIKGDAFDLLVDYHLEDLGGRTRLTQDSRVRFQGFLKLIGSIMTPFVKKSSRKALEDSFAKLKELVEGGDGAKL